MTNEEILMLVKAGYTKSDIEAMTPAQAPEETAAPAAQPETKAEPADVQADPAPAAQPETNAPADVQQTILAALERLSNQMIASNINNNTQPQQPTRTAADALAEIIAPPAAKRNGLGGK